MTLKFVEDLLQTQEVTDEKGNVYKLHGGIDRAEGEFLHSLIFHNKVERSLEIGCAFGISSLYICHALSQKKVQHHIIIDPHQSSEWHNIGMTNLKRAGFTFPELIEEPSEIALPRLLQQEEGFDFAFIDGWHTFDHALVDFFYVNRLLNVQGIVVFDDMEFPQLRKLVRYIRHYPNYEVIGSVPRYWRPRGKVAPKVASLIKLLPEKINKNLVMDNFIRPNISLVLNASMVALRKNAPDERNWDWYVPF
jgi:predicted O-methyltransferase YrrM